MGVKIGFLLRFNPAILMVVQVSLVTIARYNSSKQINGLLLK